MAGVGSEGQVLNPMSINLSDGSGANSPPTQGKQGEYLVSEAHGKYFVAAQRKGVYTAHAAAVAIPHVVTTGMVSVFTLWNPQGSGIIAEMINTSLSTDIAATIVDTIGWYATFGNVAAAGTFSTPGVGLTNLFSGRLGEAPSNQVQFYSAYTFLNTFTMARVDIIGTYGALTNSGPVISKNHDGTLLVQPGTALGIAASTTVTTATGTDIQATWAEWPYI